MVTFLFSFCLVLVVLASHFRSRMDPPEKKYHMESGLDQRDEAAAGFIRQTNPETQMEPGKKNDRGMAGIPLFAQGGHGKINSQKSRAGCAKPGANPLFFALENVFALKKGFRG